MRSTDGCFSLSTIFRANAACHRNNSGSLNDRYSGTRREFHHDASVGSRVQKSVRAVEVLRIPPIQIVDGFAMERLCPGPFWKRVRNPAAPARGQLTTKPPWGYCRADPAACASLRRLCACEIWPMEAPIGKDRSLLNPERRGCGPVPTPIGSSGEEVRFLLPANRPFLYRFKVFGPDGKPAPLTPIGRVIVNGGGYLRREQDRRDSHAR